MLKVLFINIILMVLTILGTCYNTNCIKLNAQENTSQHYEINGKEFDTIKYIDDGKVYLTVTPADSPTDVLNYIISETEIAVTYKGNTYITPQNNVYGESKTILFAKTLATSSIKYGNKVYEKMNKKYYYCYGVNGEIDYLKIGCNYNYRINLTSLSSTRKSNVNKYINYIDKCNSDYNAVIAAEGAAFVSEVIGFGGGGILLAAVAPEALVVAVLAAGFTGTLGGLTAAITKLINAAGNAKKAGDIYDTIKLYGTKL